MLADTTEFLIATARERSATDADLNRAAHKLLNEIDRASNEDISGTLKALSTHFELDDLSRSAFLAMVCGAIVERGYDPSGLAVPLTNKLASLLESSAKLMQVCKKWPRKTEQRYKWKLRAQCRTEIGLAIRSF
jgi:hypothetical protein